MARNGKLTAITEGNLKKRLGTALQRNGNGRIMVNVFLNEGVVAVPPGIESWRHPGIIEMDFCGKIKDGRLWGEEITFHTEEGQLIQVATEIGINISAIGQLNYYPQAQGFNEARAKEREKAREWEELHQKLRMWRRGEKTTLETFPGGRLG